jgi:hypothetical protein
MHAYSMTIRRKEKGMREREKTGANIAQQHNTAAAEHALVDPLLFLSPTIVKLFCITELIPRIGMLMIERIGGESLLIMLGPGNTRCIYRSV